MNPKNNNFNHNLGNNFNNNQDEYIGDDFQNEEQEEQQVDYQMQYPEGQDNNEEMVDNNEMKMSKILKMILNKLNKKKLIITLKKIITNIIIIK